MLKNALLYLPGTLLPRMASFVVLIAATHLLDKDQVGVLSLIILIGEVSEGISLNWLRIAFVRKLGRVSSVPRKTIIEAAKIASPAVGVAAAFSTVFIFSTKIENVEGFILAVFSYILSNSLLKFGLIFLQVAGRKKTYSILESTRSAAVVLGALTVMNLTNNAYLVSVTMTAITSSFGCIALLLTWRNAPDIENVIKRADILPLAAPLITLAIFNFSITSLDRFALGIFQSTAIVGVYAAGYSIARQGFDVLASAINTSGFPDLVTSYESGNSTLARITLERQATLVLSMFVSALVGIIMLRNDLVLLILPEDYRGTASTIIPIISIGAVALNIKNTVTDNVLLLVKRNWLQLIGLATGAVVTLAIGLMFVPSLGALGAAYAFSFGGVACVLVSWLQSRKFIKIGFSSSIVLGSTLPPLLVAAICTTIQGLIPSTDPAIRILLGGIVGGSAALFALAVVMKFTAKTSTSLEGKL